MSAILVNSAKVFAVKQIQQICSAGKLYRPMFYSGEYGSGVGKGGGTGGSVRDAGGAFGKMEAAHEEQYIRKLQALQLKELKKHHDEEIEAHEREIRRHKESIERLRKRKSEVIEKEKEH